jgi:cytochrome c oxidase subunit II
MGLLLFALFRRRSEDHTTMRGGWDVKLVIAGGVVVPALVIATLFVITLLDMSMISKPASRDTLSVEITGHQFWWEIRYPQLGIVTANELHVPTNRTVALELTSEDVIHSFWVPRLHTQS